jgi:hypothetical protein
MFKRWFPICQGDSPTAADIDALCLTFQFKLCPLGDDRNHNRAHFFETKRRARRVGESIKMLDLTELDELFQYCDDLLGDLSELGAGASLHSDNLNLSPCATTAEDLADLILMGDMADVAKFRKDRDRESFYARLHEIHDSEDEPDSPEFFNDAQWTQEYLTEIGLWGVSAANPATGESGESGE